MNNEQIPCDVCKVVLVDKDIHKEELGMCLDCSNEYWSHEDEEEFQVIKEYEAMEMFDAMLDDCYHPVFIAYGEFFASTILKDCDPIGYRQLFIEYVDTLPEDGIKVEGYHD